MGYAARRHAFTIRCRLKSRPTGGISKWHSNAWTAPAGSSRIAAVKTNIPFWKNVIHNAVFRSGSGDYHAHRQPRRLFQFKPPPDPGPPNCWPFWAIHRQRQPASKGHRLKTALAAHRFRRTIKARARRRRARGSCCWKWARGNSRNGQSRKSNCWYGHTFRTAHHPAGQRPYVVRHAGGGAGGGLGARPVCLAWKCGGATFDSRHAVPATRSVGAVAPSCVSACPIYVFKCSFRGANAVGYSIIPTTGSRALSRQAAAGGIRHFPHFDSLNLYSYLTRPWTRCRKRTPSAKPPFATPATFWTRRDQVIPALLSQAGAGTGEDGAHFLCIKDMAGLCRPFAARALVKALKEERTCRFISYARHQRRQFRLGAPGQ